MSNNFYGFSFLDELRTILETLTVTFIILKLTDVIDWSWFWVTSPFLIPFSLALIMLITEGVIRMKKDKNKTVE